jgi:[protein-PII] uridylyltransferase
MLGPTAGAFSLDTMAGASMRDETSAEDRRRPRALLASAREQFTTAIERGLGGRAAHARFSDHMDDLIRGLVGSALAASPVNMAVAALGGYGRRALSPHSDVDLLLVFAGDIGTAEEAFLKGVLHPLWDLGLTVGHQVRTLEEALTIEVDNPTFLLSQADARLLAGSPALFAYIDRRGPSLTGKARELVIEALLRLTTGRYDAFNDTIYQLEPDIKEAPGGLRDIVAARLLASLAHDPAAIDEDDLEQAENFVLRVRGILHLAARRNSNILSHELQERVAERLRFPGADPTQRVEALMSRYFAHARTVARALETAVARVTPAPQALAVPVGANVELAGGAIRFIDGARASTEPASWLGVFEAALEHGATVAPETLGLMDGRGSRYALADLLPSPEARRRFVQMLRPRRGLYAVLSAMHDCRLLERLITGFGRISGRMIRDFYHKYTVDEHTLLTVRGIERLVTKPSKRPRFAELIAELHSPERLVLALLLHDIGKWKDENHAEESARMAQVIFDELGLDGETRHDVDFLIVQHLEMSRVTFRRDNSDARVIRQFADVVGTEARLQMLCLLTLADIGAVGPGTLTPWKEDLLWEVFVRTYNELTHGYGDSTIAAGEAALAALEGGRPSDLAADELSRVLEGFPRRYLTSVDPTQIYRHVRLARGLRHDEVHLLLDRRGDAWELAVVALDKPHLFSNICGTLAFCGMDILRGSAMTSRSGLVLDIFHFVDGEHFFDRNADGPARFEALLQEVVAGREDIAARLLRKEKGLLHRRTPVRVAPVIQIDNEQSPTYTVLELVAQDAPGLLHRVSRVVSGHGCEVDLVLISTEGNRAIDVFHLTQSAAKLPRPVSHALKVDLERLLQEGS